LNNRRGGKVGKMMRKPPELNKGYALFTLIFAMTLGMLLHSDLVGADASRYLFWTRSLFFDHDFLFINEFEIFGGRLFLTPTGYALEFHNFGTAIFWLPFYAVAHWLAGPEAKSGFESIYILLINFSTWIYGGLTLPVLYQLAGRYGRPKAVIAAIIAVSLGSSYFYYIIFLPASSHIISVFLAAFFLTLWQATRRRTAWQLWLALGVIGGALILVASYNLPYLFLPGLSLYQNRWHRRYVALGAAYALAALLTFIPQLFIWGSFSGHPFTTPYSAQLFWTEPQLILTWFSTWHGLFIFAPILWLALPGGYFLWKQDNIMAAGVALIFFSFSYIISVNAAWWGGSSFGARYFISLTPIFVLAVTALLERFKNPRGYLLAGLLSLWTILLYAQTALGLINIHNWYPLDDLAAGQWQAAQQLLRLVLGANLPATQGPFLTMTIGLAAGSLMIVGGMPLLLGILRSKLNDNGLLILPALSLAIFAFLWYAGGQGAAAISRLAGEGFYQNKEQIYTADPTDGMKNYHNLAHFYLKHGQPAAAVATMQRAILGWPHSIRHIIPTLPTGADHALDLNFGDVVRLVGYSLAKKDGQLQATLYWQRLAAETDEVHYTFRLKEQGAGTEIAQYRAQEGLIGPSLVGVYPLDEIPDGMFFRDTFEMAYQPAELFGAVHLSLAEVGLQPHLPDGTALEEPTLGFIDLSATGQGSLLNENFEHKIILASYYAALDPTGQSLTLALRWQCLAPLARDYKIFIHLIDANGKMITQRDLDPLGNLRPTSGWQPGEELLEVYHLPLSPENAAPPTAILLGFYFLETGERLFVVDEPAGEPRNYVRLELD
jgi:hypothetical protein